MKRFSMFAVGVLFVWTLLPALAYGGLIYETGPLQSYSCITGFPAAGSASTVYTKVINNDPIKPVTAIVRFYVLASGAIKPLPVEKSITIAPGNYDTVSNSISACSPYDVQVELMNAANHDDPIPALNTDVNVFQVLAPKYLVTAPNCKPTGMEPASTRVVKKEMSVITQDYYDQIVASIVACAENGGCP